MTSTTPCIYLPHGGGPWPFVEMPLGDSASKARFRAWLESLSALGSGVRSILVISAHWEEDVPTVMTAARPELYFDYYGFPPHTYELSWPAPGAPDLARRVASLLQGAGFATAEDPRRGFDHGTFIPLMLPWPEPAIPVTQLSLVRGLDPEKHLALGRALRPLRDEGVLLIGSGMSFHNMRAFGNPAARSHAIAFDDWLAETAALPTAQREARLARWADAPSARFCHPREEHLIPLHVVAGAAADSSGSLPFRDDVLGVRVSAVQFT